MLSAGIRQSFTVFSLPDRKQLLAELKFRSAAAIYPDSLAIRTPRSVAFAGTAADLPSQGDPVARVRGTIVPAPVVRVATNRASVACVVALVFVAMLTVTRSSGKLCAAAVVHPYAVAIIAPGLIRHAGGAANLIHHSDSSANVDIAVVTPPIVRVAADGFRPEVAAFIRTAIVGIVIHRTFPATATARNEFRPATAIYPYASAVIAPRRSLYTSRAADLSRQPNTTRNIDIAIVTPAIVRRTTYFVLRYQRGCSKTESCDD